jgi:hypothetical protein
VVRVEEMENVNYSQVVSVEYWGKEAGDKHFIKG